MKSNPLQKSPKAILADASAISGQALRMPMPKRMSLPEVRDIRDFMLGSDFCTELHGKARTRNSALHIATELYNSEPGASTIQRLSLTKNTLMALIMIEKQDAWKAPIFTVNPPLLALLEDTGIKDNIPAQFFSPPYPVCYIEFDPAEDRDTSHHRTFASGRSAICEGAYVIESHLEHTRMLRPAVREALDLDPNAPTRLLEVGFSASPVGNSIYASASVPVAVDDLDLMTIYIQDEQESLGEILARHFSFYRGAGVGELGHTPEGKSFDQHFRENFELLTKIFFYLNVEHKARRTEKPASELEEKLKNTASKKHDKLKKQLQRVYDRIVIGPDQYTPIKALIEGAAMAKGTKAPHYRRGFFGVRWKGTGQSKTAELVRVTHTVVNKHLIVDSNNQTQVKNYEIR